MQALAARTSQKRFQKSELLFAEGDPCTGLYLVASGKVRIFKLSASGREQVLAVEGPGSSFAELPVFDGGNYPAAASAMEDTEVLFISRKDFQGFCREHPEVALKVIAVVASRLRRLVGIIEELSFTTVRQRLIALLLKQAEATGTQLMRSHLDLAAELGSVRGTGLAKSQPSAGRRVSRSGRPQHCDQRLGRFEARVDRLRIILLNLPKAPCDFGHCFLAEPASKWLDGEGDMKFSSETEVHEIALARPGARRILEDAGVDYCRGGGKSLQEACLHADVPAEEILNRLHQNSQLVDDPEETQWTSRPLAELTRHIRQHHHRYVRDASPQLRALLAR